MRKTAICTVCGGIARPAETCMMCGAIVCRKCFDLEKGICKRCELGRI